MAVAPRTQEPSQKQRKRRRHRRARRRGWLFWESLFRPEAVAFRRLCRMEPRLYALYEEACAVEYDPDAAVFCATIVFYDHFKPRVDALLAGHVRRTGGVPFDPSVTLAAYRQIHRALPRCRKCSCW